MRKKNLRKYKKYTKKRRKNKKRKRKQKKSHKIMKGGSMAGNFFRFLAGENDRDRIKVKELKELHEYKKERQKNEERELEENVNTNDKKLSMEQNEELNNYKNNNDIVDGSDIISGINDLNKGIREDNKIDLLAQTGGGLLDSINQMEKLNFNKWFQGSTNAYNNVINRNDPNGFESKEWERKMVDGNPHHQIAGKRNTEVKIDTNNCPMAGGRRRRKRSKKRKYRRKRKSRKK